MTIGHAPFHMEALQMSLDLFDHFGILFIGQLLQAGVHGEYAAPLKLVLVLGHEVEVQVAAGIAVSAVVDLVGVESSVDGFGGAIHIGKEGIAVFVADVDDLADVIFVGHDAAAGMALLFEQEQGTHAQVANMNAESSKGLAVYAVSAIRIFHDNDLPKYQSFYINWRFVNTTSTIKSII